MAVVIDVVGGTSATVDRSSPLKRTSLALKLSMELDVRLSP